MATLYLAQHTKLILGDLTRPRCHFICLQIKHVHLVICSFEIYSYYQPNNTIFK